MDQQYPDTDLPAYCRGCRAAGGCDATKGEVCPRPQLLPESLPALRAYDTCSTQWRAGLDGATGLDYSACISTLERYVPRWNKEQPTAEPLDMLDLLDELRTIEQALLTAWAEHAEKKRAARENKAADE